MKANLTIFFLLIFVVAAVIGWDWPNIAKIMPVYVAAIPGIILVLVQLYREVTGSQGRRSSAGGIDMDEVSDVQLDRQTELRRTVGYFAWFIGGALGIWLGYRFASASLSLHADRRQGKMVHRSDCHGLHLCRRLGSL
jgi:hypothetical protein